MHYFSKLIEYILPYILNSVEAEKMITHDIFEESKNNYFLLKKNYSYPSTSKYLAKMHFCPIQLSIKCTSLTIT